MTRLLETPRLTLWFALGAALAALAVILYLKARPDITPLSIVSSSSNLSTYDSNYWATIARQKPKEWSDALTYCARNPSRPNCEALRSQAFSATIEEDARRSATLPIQLATPGHSTPAVRPEGR